MTRRGLMLAGAAASALRAQKAAAGRVLYVSEDGSDAGDGSVAHPWPSVEYALARAGGGNEIVVLPGYYRGVRIAREFSGTASAPTVIRAGKKWKAVVLGATGLGVSIEAAYVVVDGLEVAGSRIDGIKASGDHATIRNCWLHNNSAQGVAIHGRAHWTIERNLIEFNGQHPQLQHGIYADGEDGSVRANVIRHNSGYGVQLYPAMRGVTVENNLIHGHSTKGGIVLAAAGGRNAIVNNTIADNAYGIRLMGGAGQVIANNIICGRGEAVSRDAEAGEPVLECNLTEDPGFIDRTREVYFLAPGSTAIGKASPARRRRRTSGAAGGLPTSARFRSSPILFLLPREPGGGMAGRTGFRRATRGWTCPTFGSRIARRAGLQAGHAAFPGWLSRRHGRRRRQSSGCPLADARCSVCGICPDLRGFYVPK